MRYVFAENRKYAASFACTGHFSYVKGILIFLLGMSRLSVKMNTEEYELFTEQGYFIIGRTDKALAGVWSDMMIEITLNKFYGTDLKHGQGITPSVVARYLLGMPSAFQVLEALEEYAELINANSEQHVETHKSRIRRDNKDLEKFSFWLQSHDPFKARVGLTSLSRT